MTYGGIELIINLLTEELVRRGHEVTLFATGDSATSARLQWTFPSASGFDGQNPMIALERDSVHAAAAINLKDEFDVIHAHSPYAALYLGALSGSALVLTEHGWHASHSVFPIVGSRVDVVAPTRAYWEELPRMPHSHVVHHGIDTSRYAFHSEGGEYLAFVGRMTPEKGLHLAIETARRMDLPLKAVAVGLGLEAEQSYFESVIAPLLGQDVDLNRDGVTFDEKVELLGGARALLFPINWREPFGLIVVESMACGTPVVASNRGGMQELVSCGESGYVVRHEHFVRDATEVLTTRVPVIDRMKVRTWACAHFDATLMTTGYEMIYESVITRKEGGCV